MSQKVLDHLYRLTEGRALREIPVQVLKISCRNITMDYLNERLNDLETLGYVNTFKKVVGGNPQILSVELTTYGKRIFQKDTR